MLIGCGGDDNGTPDAADDAPVSVDAGLDATVDAPADVKIAQEPPFDIHADDRAACAFGAGALTTDTVGPNVPHGDALPFKHVVFLMMENRSFDSYFSKLPSYGVTDVDVAPDDASNPDPGPPVTQVKRFHETRYCIVNTTHDWGPVHLQYDDGAMDGFVVTNDPGGARSMGYYDQTDLPFYYWLAKTFALSDRHFSSLLGPTWPNRFFFYGATSWGRTMTPDTPPLNETKIVNEMDDAGRSWQIYRDGLLDFTIVFGPQYAGTSMSNFFSDVANDTLPDLSILDPSFNGTAQDDEHPPTNMQLGQALSAKVIAALMANPAVWQSTVFIQTYDEHGGFYDHVAPPPACVPDGNAPPDYAFDRLGVRVPMFVVSAFAKKDT
ncbi:MAG TPA: alkaline phosphatase family protein [Polyangiaceae bacterium]